MKALSQAQLELAKLIVTALELEDIDAAGIGPDEPLFGAEDGLGLDSIDALEIALAVSKEYGVELKADDERNRQIFATLASLSAHIETMRKSGAGSSP